MNEIDAGPRAGLFPEGPILDVPFAIAMAASALRRFTLGELARCSGRREDEAAAWIEANLDTLQVVEGGVPWAEDEPAWRRTPESEEGFSAALRAMDPLELHVRLHGEWRQRVDRLEAVDHAEFYAEASKSCEAGVDVDECRNRALG